MMSNQHAAGLITAAGMSSRMDGFKPLMKLGEKTLLQMGIDCLRAAGAQHIYVTIGRCAEKMSEAVISFGATPVFLSDYYQKQMLDSVQTGLRAIQQKGGYRSVIILPVDTPAVKPETVGKLLQLQFETDAAAVRPAFCGKHGHPLLLNSKIIPEILAYQGENGLRGALNKFDSSFITCNTEDRGVLLDADTPEDFTRLQEYIGKL